MLIKGYGGPPGIRDLGLVEIALLQPQTGYCSDLIEEAAALWDNLFMNHGFVDASKTVGFACMEIFMELYGLVLTAGEDETIQLIYKRLESGTFTKDTLDTRLGANTASI